MKHKRRHPRPLGGSLERAVAVGKGRAQPLTRAASWDGAVLPMRDLAGWWARELVNPVATMRALPDAGWPKAGLVAVVTRFVVQDLLETLPLALLGRRPFMPAKLPIRPEHHYRAQIVFLPVFGVGSWLLMGGAAHGLLRLSGERSDLSRVLDVIGTGMLIPMPALWLCDMALIAAGRFRLPELAFVNPTVQLWETALFGIGHSAGCSLATRHVGRARSQRGLRPRSIVVRPVMHAWRPLRRQMMS